MQVMQQMQQQIAQMGAENQQLQMANAQLQGIPGQGPGMEGAPMQQSSVQGPMPVGGGSQGQGNPQAAGGQGGV